MDLEAHYQQQLSKIVLGNERLFLLLKELQNLGDGYFIAAGAIRNTVWSALHAQLEPLQEIDVIFHDLKDKSHAATVQKLKNKYPKFQWDVVNQADVHEWYICDNGQRLDPLPSIEYALSLWPETATAIAVRLKQDGDLEVIAPFGLTDLFELKLRWNTRLVHHATFLQRVESKQFLRRWPKLTLVEPFE